jgi:hypothetical protein
MSDCKRKTLWGFCLFEKLQYWTMTTAIAACCLALLEVGYGRSRRLGVAEAEGWVRHVGGIIKLVSAERPHMRGEEIGAREQKSTPDLERTL